MPLITTPGASDADSYASVADCAAYAAKVGAMFVVAPVAPAEAALRRATAWIDAEYGPRFVGDPTESWQALEWPRTGAMWRGAELPDDAIPQAVVSAVCEAAIREFAKPGSLAPDLKRGGQIKAVGAGSARVEFADGAPAGTAFTKIDGLLRGLLSGAEPEAGWAWA